MGKEATTPYGQPAAPVACDAEKTCRCNDNDLQDIGDRKIGLDLSIELLQNI